MESEVILVLEKHKEEEQALLRQAEKFAKTVGPKGLEMAGMLFGGPACKMEPSPPSATPDASTPGPEPTTDPAHRESDHEAIPA